MSKFWVWLDFDFAREKIEPIKSVAASLYVTTVKVTILYILLRLIAKKNLQPFALLFLQRSQFQGLFCKFRFAQSLQNHFKCLHCSLFTNKFMYACFACMQIRPLPCFFRSGKLWGFFWCFTAGWMLLYLIRALNSTTGTTWLLDDAKVLQYEHIHYTAIIGSRCPLKNGLIKKE